MEASRDRSEQRKLVREVVDEVEAVRLKRQAQWREGGHADCKRFTQEELTDLAYGAYKNMMLGRTLRIPSRAALLRIASYLECTIHETNDLLMAAQYLPEVVDLREDEQRAVLERAKALLHTFPLPAYLLSCGWVIEDANNLMHAANNLAASYRLAGRRETPLEWLGNPVHPSHANYTFDETLWQRTVRNVFQQFRDAHQRYQRERWYQEQLNQLRTLPRFASCWDTLLSSTSGAVHPGATYQWSPHVQTAFYDAPVVLKVSTHDFPQLVVYHPVDTASFMVYEALGCPIRENHWESVLMVGATH